MKKKLLMLLTCALVVSCVWARNNEVAALSPSGTLPVFYLNTENAVEITDKENYINATMYIDGLNTGLPSYGSVDNQAVTETKGRGNYTWTGFDKKPYRIKMAAKAELLNMTKDKSFNLLPLADDETFVRNEVGFELSRRLGLLYTVKQEPVELVLNGQYWGLYFLNEHIKISKKRINIPEQVDLDTDPTTITGGWLMEIDNYPEDGQVSTSRIPYITSKSPELLSPEQEAYIRNFLQTAENAIYVLDKTDNTWENYIDLDALVNFYIIQEITGNTESFHGSCYFTKDRGDDTKLVFGPVWDFGNAFRHGHCFIYDCKDSNFASHWIEEIVKFPHFQQVLKERWTAIRTNELVGINDYLDGFHNKIKNALSNNYNRWASVGSNNVAGSNGDFTGDFNKSKAYISDRIAWLDTKWKLSTTESITVKFKKPVDWESVYFHAWNNNAQALLGGGWPGKEATPIPGADGWWSFTFTGAVVDEIVGVVISQGGQNASDKQTANLTVTKNICLMPDYDIQDNRGNPSVKEIECPSISGIDSTPVTSSIRVYPNPNPGRLYVDSSDDYVDVKLYNLLSKHLKTYRFVKGYVDLDVENGTYIVHVITPKGEQQTKIIIVKK